MIRMLALGLSCAAIAANVGCDEQPGSEYATSTTTYKPAVADTVPSTSLDSPASVDPSTPPRSTRLVDKTFDDIKFDIEPDAPYDRSMLTDEIEQLVGSRIRIRGWMYPTFLRKNIKTFVLVRDNLECCFGPGAALYDCIRVEMQGDAATDFHSRPIAVEGTFKVEEFEIDGVTRAVFFLEGERVR